MKTLLLLTLTAVASGVPDVSHLGYRYQIPSTSYGTPISPADSSLVYPTRQYYHVRNSGPNTINPGSPSTEFQVPIREYSSFSSGGISEAGNAATSGKSGDKISSSGAISSGTASSGISGSLGGRIYTSNGHSGLSTSGQTGFSSFDSRGSFQQQQVDVQRHIYFYAPPEEPEEVRPRVNLPVVTPKKNVKIIFIKAPTYSAPAPLQIPVLPQNEEKTLVYVLVKNPEEHVQIDIPTPAPTKPSKPEVYFIKYQTQQEAEEVISNVQNGLATGGTSANSVEGGQEFINTIGQGAISSSRDNGVSLTSLPVPLDERLKVKGKTDVSDGDATGGTTSLTGRFGEGSVYSISSIRSSTTASSVEPVSVGTGSSSSSGIHQLYGPPK